MAIICGGCGQRVEPVKVFERSSKNGKEWLISRCPRERCGFNIDLERFMRIRNKKDAPDRRSYIWGDEA